MKTFKNKKTLKAIHAVTENNTVFFKLNNGTHDWQPVKFQWVPVCELKKNINQ